MTKIEPGWALRPGRRDPLALLVVWFVRKSFYWTLGLGLLVAAVAGRVDELDDVSSPGQLWDHLLSPLVVVLVSLVLRFGSSQAALVLAWPLARAHEVGLEPRTNFGSSIGKFLDRLHVARAYRSLRWTHHVRQVAIGRLGTTGARLGRLDPVMDLANIVLIVGGLVAISVLTPTTA